MASSLNPYINLRDGAREAITFYASVFGGEPTITTFGEGGGAAMGIPDDELGKVMHSQLVAPNGFTLMVSDMPSYLHADEGSNVSISLSGTDEAELTGYWDKIADGATITAPLNRAPWGDVFGMCVDRFGVGWMVNITAS